VDTFGILEIYNLLVGLIITIGMIVAKSAWTEIGRVRDCIRALEKEVPETYVRRDDYKDDITDIKSMLHHIFNKLDSKADKP